MKDARIPRTRSAVVVLIDAHAAIIDRCDDGALTRVRLVSTPEPHGTSDHMGDAPRQTYHSGTRGETAGEAAQRARTAARRRFIAHVTPIIAGTATPGELIVIGGSRLFTNALRDSLATLHARDAVVADGLHRAQAAEAIVARVMAAVNDHLAVRDLADVRALLERTGAHTTGVVGPVASLDAIEHGAADVVLMTPRYREEHTTDAARLVVATRAQGGRVETVSDGAAALLDAHAGGVGTLLRYSLHRAPVYVSENP